MPTDPITAAKIAAVASKVTTIGTARAAMGACTGLLRQAYAKTEEADLWDEAELKDAIRDRLDIVNSYGAQIYGMIGTSDPDLQEEEISTLNSGRVGLFIAQTYGACKEVDEALNENAFDVLTTVELALTIAGETAGRIVQSIMKSAAAGGAAFVASAWPTLLLMGGAVAVYFWIRAGRPMPAGGP